MKKLKFFFFIFLLSPFFTIIFLIRPIIFLRFGLLATDRIGNILDYELYKIYKKKNLNNFEIFFSNNFICNYQYLKILKRHFFVLQNLKIFYVCLTIVAKYFPVFKKHLIDISKHTYDFENKLNVTKTKLDLLPNEILKGKKILQRYNLNPHLKIVCITCRDKEYLKKTSKINFDYHNYRDSSLKNLIPAIKLLLKKKFIVIRMGKIVEKKLKIKHENFIDYPFHPIKSDFMDFYLAKSCFLWIGNNTGLDELARLFRRPLLVLNMAPIGILKLGYRKSVLLTKKLKYKKKIINLSLIFKKQLTFMTNSLDYKKKKIDLKENSSNEIINSLKNILMLIQNKWIISNKNFIMQNKFRNSLFHNVKRHKLDYVYCRKPEAIICSNFIKKNNWLLK